MYRVLIVDDEEHIRQGLRNIIDWSTFGFEILAEASNGGQALHLTERLKPDLVITDIKMPEMNGLDMIRQLRLTGYSGFFILITGFADFTYAQTAIRYGVKSYLLKPINERALAGELYSIRKELEASSLVIDRQDTFSVLTREKLLEQFITGISSYETLSVLPDIPTWEKSGNSLQIILISFSLTNQEGKTLEDFHLALQRFIAKQSCQYLYSTNKSYAILSINRSKTNTLVFNKLQKDIFAEFHINLFISIGKKVSSFANLPQSYESADQLFDKLFLYGYKGLVSAESLPRLKEQAPIALEDMIKRLAPAIEYHSLEDISRCLERWMNSFIERDASEMEVKTEYINLFINLVDYFRTLFPDREKDLFDRQGFIESAYLKNSIMELNSELKALLVNISGEFEALHPDNIVEKLIRYMKNNYNKDISITSMAQSLHYSRTYLGRKFKSSTGESFTDYLDRLRVEKAKELLEKGYLVYQAAEMVGYKNVDYFNIKFKKYEKVSPSHYKKKR